MGRAPCCDKSNVKRGPWSPDEDTKLKDYIQNYGTGGNWIALPRKAGLKRCGKSCRLRWLNYLRPNIKHGEFSNEENRVICSLYASIGSRWSIIAAQLPGRTDNDIKNYWNTKLKKKLMENNNKMNSPSTTTTCLQNTLKYKNDQTQNNPMISSLFSQPPFQYNNNSPTSNIMSFSNNISTISQPSLPMQVKDNSTLLMFGGLDQKPTTSSDGSCSINNNNINNQVIVKCEDHNNIYDVFNNNNNNNNNNQVNYEEDQKPNLIKINNNINSNVLWGQNSQQITSKPLLEYGLEEIKQLISSANNNEVNYFDEIKSSTAEEEEEEKSKMMYYCNYY